MSPSLPVESPATITHLDEDWAVPCGVTNHRGEPDCHQPAEWLAWQVACCPAGGDGVTWCTPHKDQWLSPDIAGSCESCGRDFTPLSSAFTLIEPLNRRTT